MSTTGPLQLKLYSTASRSKEAFRPIDPSLVRMYVCGVTVYDRAHIGNARPMIVFDVLFRLLRHRYGAAHVSYVRNITDIDDKINVRAAERFPEMEPKAAIRRLTEETAAQLQKDIAPLGLLPPTREPRATDHIAEMVELCDRLIANGHAYVAEEHVLFSVPSMADYGKLSGRSLEEMEAGSRVDVAPYKRDPMDFVLWKPSSDKEPGWPSPAGIKTPGRPGWHIECSAMAWKHLGEVFDIHAGGIDLVFPHHENELAQSRCSHGEPRMANVWMHNGFLQVDGEKMSKSLGNFITIGELLETERYGGRRWHGLSLRLAMLGTHYRQPIDWTLDRLARAEATLMDIADVLHGVDAAGEPHREVLEALADDLNTPKALSIIHALLKSARRNSENASQLKATLQLVGLYGNETAAEIRGTAAVPAIDEAEIARLIEARLAARKSRDFKESDRIRDELAAKGIALKDAKDAITGDIVTTWETRR